MFLDICIIFRRYIGGMFYGCGWMQEVREGVQTVKCDFPCQIHGKRIYPLDEGVQTGPQQFRRRRQNSDDK